VLLTYLLTYLLKVSCLIICRCKSFRCWDDVIDVSQFKLWGTTPSGLNIPDHHRRRFFFILLLLLQLESPHSSSHRPLYQHFPRMTLNFITMSVTYEFDLNWVKVNRPAKYVGQRSLLSKVIARIHRHTHTVDRSH